MARIEGWNPPQIDDISATIGYHAGHAPIIHNGAVRRSGGVQPASPWITTTVYETDCPDVFVQNYSGVVSSDDIRQAFIGFIEDLADDMTTNLETQRWYHPNDTLRQSGEYVVAGLRNRVDLGELRDSQEVRFG